MKVNWPLYTVFSWGLMIFILYCKPGFICESVILIHKFNFSWKSHKNLQGDTYVNLLEFRTYVLSLSYHEIQSGISQKFLGTKLKCFTVPKNCNFRPQVKKFQQWSRAVYVCWTCMVCTTRAYSEFQAHRLKSMTWRVLLRKVKFLLYCDLRQAWTLHGKSQPLIILSIIYRYIDFKHMDDANLEYKHKYHVINWCVLNKMVDARIQNISAQV